jgi:predicted ATPase
MKDVGIVGLPQSGKTTLFNALTRAGVAPGGGAGNASGAALVPGGQHHGKGVGPAPRTQPPGGSA